jgi:hypothetical protein
MPAAIPSLGAKRRAPIDSQGREVVGALTTLMMKYPPQNGGRTLQAKTWTVEPNPGGIHAPRAREQEVMIPSECA